MARPIQLKYRHRSQPARRNRRGMAVIIVLSLISVTMAISYAMLRTQTMGVVIQGNSSRRSDARNAAVAGLNVALQKMTESDWAGVDTPVTGRLSSTESYSVTYTTGDASLAEGDEDYEEYPYRITVLSTGYAADPSSSVRATHQVQAVVQLIRRKLSETPSGWDDVQQHALYQWSADDVTADLPLHINGKAYLGGSLQLAPDYPHDSVPFDGSIDEVAIYNSAISETDILKIYQSATGSVSHFTDLESAYTHYSPVAWWRFDESVGQTTATDQAGNYDGTYIGAQAGSSGAPLAASTTAANFDGINDYVDAGRVSSGDAEMTIFAWIKADSLDNTNSAIISKAMGSASSEHFWTLCSSSETFGDRLKFSVRTPNGLFPLTDWSGTLATDRWYFVAVVVEEYVIDLYRDGVKVARTGKSGYISTDPKASVFIGDDPPGRSRARYLRDLNEMQIDGLDDNRPFTGPVSLSTASTSAAALDMLQENLGVTVNDVTPTHTSPSTFPESVSSYQLYPGGKEYTVETIGSVLSYRDEGPDQITNPLGIFRQVGGVAVSTNVKIEGTLIVDGTSSNADLKFFSTGASLKGVDLPPLADSSERIQLPVAIIKDSFYVNDGCDATISGMVWAGGNAELQKSGFSTQMNISGSLVSSGLLAYGRSLMYYDQSTWQLLGSYFQQYVAAAEIGGFTAKYYFPQFIEDMAFSKDPALTVDRESAEVSYHWHNWDNPIFMPHPDDGGLRWDLIEWTDSP